MPTDPNVPTSGPLAPEAQPAGTPPAGAQQDGPGASVRDDVRNQMKQDDPADVAVNAVDELAEQATEMERLREENKSLQDQLLRRAAEFQNYRRRTDEQRSADEARARDSILVPFLEIYDDLRRSLDASRRQGKQDGEGTSPAFEALAEGIELVFKKYGSTLEKMCVERIEATGQPFSEDLHEAMMQQPAPDADTPSGTVLAEIQPGYRIGDRILRHARVIVAG
ncbi:nucleotide exchange factor GrpE [Rubricoccus marinus]|uniref:Protein GrpE n=1 Tax=Rubricoccus marinus TaxID=716817 RepID=A0A259TVZ3_9BACT|nr:nucleotide exchange factor GrpE [Rubricoccus marinus]OZC01939.1 nucleotide exchange factor GrpE [Rubricoccus marinus]